MTLARYGHIGSAKATTLSVAVNSAVTSMTVTDASTWSGITTNGPSVFTIDRGLSTEERILAASVSGNNLTSITRGIDGTTAAAHDAGATIEHTFSGIEADDANAHIYDTTRDDHTQYIKKSIGTAVGDLVRWTASGVVARLARGSALQVLRVNAAGTDLEYATLATGNTEFSIPAFSMQGFQGTPTQAANILATTGYLAGWTLPDGATTGIVASFVMPTGWASFAVDWWLTTPTTTGNNWRFQSYAKTTASGGTVATGGSTDTQTIAAPAADAITKLTFHASGVAATAGDHVLVQGQRNGADGLDTNTGTLGVALAVIRKVS